ncbi:MAG: hypothetical protein WKF86_06645 [Acidimicrobiales bacterium]
MISLLAQTDSLVDRAHLAVQPQGAAWISEQEQDGGGLREFPCECRSNVVQFDTYLPNVTAQRSNHTVTFRSLTLVAPLLVIRVAPLAIGGLAVGLRFGPLGAFDLACKRLFDLRHVVVLPRELPLDIDDPVPLPVCGTLFRFCLTRTHHDR